MDVPNIFSWLRGSDWEYAMYDYMDELIDHYGPGTVKKYWNFDSILAAMMHPGYEGRGEVLVLLKHMVNSDWDVDLYDYREDISDAWGAHNGRTFRLNAIIDHIENLGF